MLILADDLSGAADCGVACAAAGLRTVVALGDSAGCLDLDVLSLDADTRRMAPAAAAREVRKFIQRRLPDREILFFKKIDSTLRGNVAEELAAALDAYGSLHPGSGSAIAIMAPAFPAIGRTTVSGLQLVHGQPLHALPIWRLQGMTGRASIPDMLEAAGLKCALLSIDAIRSGDRALIDAMRTSATVAAVLVCDAETDADLRAIASASMQLGRGTMWVGSAGLAHHLPRAAGLGTAIDPVATSLPPISGPLLFVIGSLSNNSMEQVRELASSAQVQRITVPPDVLLAGAASKRWRIFEQEIQRAIQMNRDVVLCPGTDPQVEFASRPLLSESLARITFSVSGNIGALIASGGETARAVLQSWGVESLRLIGEVEKGMPLAIAENWSRPLPVVTKAGDFGNRDTLFNCLQFLHGAASSLHEPREIGKGNG